MNPESFIPLCNDDWLKIVKLMRLEVFTEHDIIYEEHWQTDKMV